MRLPEIAASMRGKAMVQISPTLPSGKGVNRSCLLSVGIEELCKFIIPNSIYYICSRVSSPSRCKPVSRIKRVRAHRRRRLLRVF